MVFRFLVILLGVLWISSASAQIQPGPTLGGDNTWQGQQIQPTCPLTDAAIIAINAGCLNGSGLYTVTLGGNRRLAFPLNTPTNGAQWFTLEVTQDSTGTRTLTPEAGYAFPFTNVNTNGTLLLSTIPKSKDVFTCWSISATAWDCLGPQVAETQYVHFTNSATTTGTSVTTLGVTIGSFTLGHTGIFIIGFCRDGSSCSTTTGTLDTSTVTATGGTCTLITSITSSQPIPIKAYRCTGMATGSVTFTANFNATAFFIALDAVEMINDQGAEASATASGSSGNAGATTGTLSQPNGEFVYFAAYHTNASQTGYSSPAAVIGSTGLSGGYINSGCNACTQAVTDSGGSGAWTALAFALKTP